LEEEGMLAPWKILLMVAVVLLVFCGNRIPDLGRRLGSVIFNFRKSVKDPDGPGEKDSRDDKGPPEPGRDTPEGA
jgi:TatA/E family protein of Tat protein translocase